MGAAAAFIFYPVFLLPVWCTFYWRRGLIRFLAGFVLAAARWRVGDAGGELPDLRGKGGLRGQREGRDLLEVLGDGAVPLVGGRTELPREGARHMAVDTGAGREDFRPQVSHEPTSRHR